MEVDSESTKKVLLLPQLQVHLLDKNSEIKKDTQLSMQVLNVDCKSNLAHILSLKKDRSKDTKDYLGCYNQTIIYIQNTYIMYF